MGRFAPRRRHHRVGRLAARRRGQAQPAAAALGAAAPRRIRPRGRDQRPAQRRHALSPQYGRGRHRERQRRLRPSARITALEGRAVGVQLAFAPVADVNNNPANPIINTRSFGEDPPAVGRLVAADVRGLQEHGMLATPKHFPGHGDTGTDSHLALPVIGATWRAPRFGRAGAVPRRRSPRASNVVMSAHIALPGIDLRRRRPGDRRPQHPHRHSARLARLPRPGRHRRAQHGRRGATSTARRGRRCGPSSPAPTCCCSPPIPMRRSTRCCPR